MTPVLRAVYDELVERASRPPFAATCEDVRRGLARRMGGRDGADEPNDDARIATIWDEAMARGGMAAAVGETLEDPAERAIARAIARSHRGVFRLERRGSRAVAVDLWGGGCFLVAARDGMALAPAGVDPAVFQGRLVADDDGCAFLPGVVFHPAQATERIETVLEIAVARGDGTDDVCDALLRMERAFRTQSRPTVAWAYRPEALDPVPADAHRLPRPAPAR